MGWGKKDKDDAKGKDEEVDIENDPMFGGIVRGANAHFQRQMEEAEKARQERNGK